MAKKTPRTKIPQRMIVLGLVALIIGACVTGLSLAAGAGLWTGLLAGLAATGASLGPIDRFVE